MPETRIGFYDKEGWDKDVYWEIKQKSHSDFQILAKNVRMGWMHTLHYTLVENPIFGIDAHDLSEINRLLEEAKRIAKDGKL